MNTPIPDSNISTDEVTALSCYSDFALLESVIALEETASSEMNFGAAHLEEDLGKHLMTLGTSSLGETVDIGGLLEKGNSEAWKMVFDVFTTMVQPSWEKTWEVCRSIRVACKLKHAASVKVLALLAWRRRAADNIGSAKESLYESLLQKSDKEQMAVLKSLALDGAASCAYEGINMPPDKLVLMR